MADLDTPPDLETHFEKAAGVGAGAPSTLPETMLYRASRRLGWLALMYGAVRAVYLLIPKPERQGTDPSLDIIHLCFLLVSLTMYGLTRVRSLPVGWILRLGLVFEVIGAAGIEISILWWQGGWWEGIDSVWSLGVSWTCVWIVMFPLVVANSPRQTFVAATLAASMRPLFLAVAVARGAPAPDVVTTLYWITPTYLCVGVAVVSSWVVYRMGREVAQARQLGSYRLTELLGSGGMGDVWRAEHRMLARPAAVKLIRAEACGCRDRAEAVQLARRFEREAKATARLSSPHTVQLYDFGVTADGTLYYVMELLHGLDLHDLVKRFGPLSSGRAVHLLSQACHSLAEAHAAGLVHRDIKPANMMLGHVGIQYDFLKVLDFGLVTGRGFGEGVDANVTAEGAITGTPAYMAPEMVRGEPVDGRTDLYALGCLAYWLLTGHQVFTGSTPMQVALAQINQQPTPPSEASEEPVPADFDALVLRCLEKRADDRPANAEEVLRALSRIPVTEPWTSTEAEAWWVRHQPVPPRQWSSGPQPRGPVAQTV